MGTLEKGIALMIPQESGSGGETIKGKTIQTSGQAVGEYIWLSSNSNAWTTISSCIPQGYMNSGRLIHQAQEVPGNVGFSLVGEHNHCPFPKRAETADLPQY
ncbi:hypothetical protein CTA2_4445, partial [Colletotrichum tanaceti]